MIQLAVNGATGRMGTRICALAKEDDRFKLVAQLHRAHEDDAQRASDQLDNLSCDAVIDFSSDAGAQHALNIAVAHNAALVVGTTALSAQSAEKMALSAKSIPVMIAPNTSRGVAVLKHLITEAARLLGSGYDIDIVDTHHAAKRDAPSGTALRLVDALRDSAGIQLSSQRVHCMRAGDVIGDHDVIFAGPGERIKISHSATTRDVFALGALDAAAWLVGRAPGMYTIEQSLGLTATGDS